MKLIIKNTKTQATYSTVNQFFKNISIERLHLPVFISDVVFVIGGDAVESFALNKNNKCVCLHWKLNYCGFIGGRPILNDFNSCLAYGRYLTRIQQSVIYIFFEGICKSVDKTIASCLLLDKKL